MLVRAFASSTRKTLSLHTIGFRHYKIQVPIIHIPKADIYRFGDSNTARPVFNDVQWTVYEDEAWAVIGTGLGEKRALFQTLLGHLRISPPPPPPSGLFPFLSASGHDPFKSVSIVSFGNRRRAGGGAFYDYTTRYGAVREEDRVTLRQTMFPETIPLEFDGDTIPAGVVARSEEETSLFERLVDEMDLGELLDLPLVALSNGQTRRARILKAILGKPELLLLDEPLTGLDVHNRPKLLHLLNLLHRTHSPRVIIGLRTQDPVPDWITHVALVRNGRVLTGKKDETLAAAALDKPQSLSSPLPLTTVKTGSLLVDMKNVNVKYGQRTVLSNIIWQIRQGERWHLQGTNGSGKTTLLALLTGDHPQSWIQDHLYLPSPSPHTNSTSSTAHLLPRKKIPTPHLQSCIGLVSPELFDAFPRRSGMSAWEAIGTGFDGRFVPLGKDGVGGVERSPEERAWRVNRCWDVIEALGPAAWGGSDMPTDTPSPSEATRAFAATPFPSLPVGAQRMVLLMRALVGQPPLVLLDEVWSGMHEGMVQAARRYLRSEVGNEQAVVVITHWEEEVPWGLQEGVKRYMLERGEGKVVQVR